MAEALCGAERQVEGEYGRRAPKTERSRVGCGLGEVRPERRDRRVSAGITCVKQKMGPADR